MNPAMLKSHMAYWTADSANLAVLRTVRGPVSTRLAEIAAAISMLPPHSRKAPAKLQQWRTDLTLCEHYCDWAAGVFAAWMEVSPNNAQHVEDATAYLELTEQARQLLNILDIY